MEGGLCRVELAGLVHLVLIRLRLCYNHWFIWMVITIQEYIILDTIPMLSQRRFSVEPLHIPSLNFHSQTHLESELNTSSRSKDLSTTSTHHDDTRSPMHHEQQQEQEELTIEEENCSEFHQEWACSRGSECQLHHSQTGLKRTPSQQTAIIDNFPELMLLGLQRKKSFLE